MVLIVGGLLLLALFSFWLVRKQDGKLRVLMYHKVDESRQDMLTVSVDQLDQHLYYLRKQGYEFISIRNIFNLSSPPSNGILLTFDDAYVNNLEYAYPILKKHRANATIFVPTAYVGDSSQWDIKAEPLLSIEALRNLDPDVFDLGLHSHTHRNYADLTEEAIKEDLQKNIQFFHQHQLPFVSAFAYPYGGRPKDKARKKAMKQIMADLGITMAFRIGNRLNSWPLSNPYEIQRIDVRGTDSLEVFARKVKWGKQF
ncbi:MAG: polysaccharide deacetylase family protein [Spirosomataceae bacterium]